MNTLVMVLSAALLALSFIIFLTRKEKDKSSFNNLPPGSFGWPILGETMSFLRASRKGRPETFVLERRNKNGCPPVFKTSIFGERMAVFCGPAGNRFLFINEGKLVALWWPGSVQKLVGSGLLKMVGEEARITRKMLTSFLGPDALIKYISIMEEVTLQHIASHWHGKEELKVYPTIKSYTFELACRLFMSIQDEKLVTELGAEFNMFLKGLLTLPINIPGTRFYRAVRAVDGIRKKLQVIIRERRVALHHSKASVSQDLLSHLLVNSDENGKFMTEMEITNNIITLLFAGHDTSTSTIVLIFKYLAELPEVYENVLKEQKIIAASKAAGEALTWEDIQKMRYSWSFISEVMRVIPPVSGSFREAIMDFTYEGYTIPKGWKLYWSAASTHKDPNIFPKTTTFDLSRFEGAGPTPFSYVPFGGGPRMCLGKEFGRIEMLVFLHNIINKFKWKLQIPDEKIIYDPLSVPVHGLPVSLHLI